MSDLAEEIAEPFRQMLRASIIRNRVALQILKNSGKDGGRPGPWGHLEEELVNHFLPLIQSGLKALIRSVPALVQRWFETKGSETQSAEAFVRTLQLDSRELNDAIRSAWEDAWLAGGKDAHDQLENPAGGVARSVRHIDWNNFTPGERRASLIVGTGFEEMLANSHITIKGVTDTVRNDIRDVLEQALKEGWSWQQAAAKIEKLVGDPFRARRIAVTEINRAMSAASYRSYLQNGWGWNLVTAPDPCPICAAIKAGNPHPSTDSHIPPYHPFCRCAAAPHIEP